jgi:hypothetical protein
MVGRSGVLQRTVRIEQGTRVMMVSPEDAQSLADAEIVDAVPGDEDRYTVTEGITLEAVREFLRIQREWHTCESLSTQAGVAVVFSVRCEPHGHKYRYVLPLDINLFEELRGKMRMPKLPDDTNLGDYHGKDHIS